MDHLFWKLWRNTSPSFQSQVKYEIQSHICQWLCVAFVSCHAVLHDSDDQWLACIKRTFKQQKSAKLFLNEASGGFLWSCVS